MGISIIHLLIGTVIFFIVDVFIGLSIQWYPIFIQLYFINFLFINNRLSKRVAEYIINGQHGEKSKYSFTARQQMLIRACHSFFSPLVAGGLKSYSNIHTSTLLFLVISSAYFLFSSAWIFSSFSIVLLTFVTMFFTVTGPNEETNIIRAELIWTKYCNKLDISHDFFDVRREYLDIKNKLTNDQE